MKVWEFEEAVWKQEAVRIVVRAPIGAEVEAYDFEHADRDERTVAIFLGDRVEPLIGDYEVSAIDGTGQRVHGARHLRNIRNTYRR